MKHLLRYRKIVWVFIILLIFTGIFTYIQLPKRDIPEINQNIASISTVYPGATPKEMEQTVTNPMEDALEDVDGISEMSSASTTGFSTITLSLDSGIDANNVYSSIRQTVSETSKSFPSEVQTPSVSTDLVKSNVATYHLLAEDQQSLYSFRDQLEHWKEELTSINGVEGLLIKGLPDEQLSISIDPEALGKNQIQPNQVITAITNATSPKALGSEQEGNTLYQLTINSNENLEDLKDIYLANSPASGKAIYLHDVASIEQINKPASDIIRYDDNYALSITVQAEEGVNIEQIQANITDKVDTLTAELPEAITVDQFYTQSTVINEVYSSLISSFVISLIAVLVIMLLGLPISSAILVALAIPISIIVGLIPLPYAGVDLNQISIIGMIVAIGILVDDAIVVNDNIQRRFQLGDPALKGTINGVREVGVSIITSTLMIVFSFFPLTFLSGSNGDFIRALPLALICTVLASTVLALTLIPTVQYTKQKNTDKQKHKRRKKKRVGVLGHLFDKIEKLYADSIIPTTLKKPWLTVSLGVVLCLLLVLLAFKVPFEFFPAADRAEVTISARLSQGTTIEDTNQTLEEMENYLLEQSDKITETVAYAGSGLPGIFNSSMTRTGENTGQLVVRVDRETTSASNFIDEWESPLREAFPNVEIFLETIVSGPPPSPSVEVKVQGPEVEQLVSIADDLKQQLADLDSAKIVTSNTSKEQNYITYQLDREFLASEGIDPNQVIGTLQLANIGIPLGNFDNGEERLPIQLSLDDGNAEGIDLTELNLAVPSSDNTSPPKILSYDSFITKEASNQIGAIPHYNGNRTITIEGYEVDGEEQTFTEEADKVIASLSEDLPDDYQIIEEGAASAETAFFVEVAKLFFIVLFLIYLTIAIQFNSLLTPLLITSTVFLAITGAIVGLFISGEPLSFLAVLGIVSLSGIVVRNSILLIEFIEQNRNIYDSVLQAIIEAGRARVRPIILTTLTSIAALVPIIFTGDVLFRPLAVSIVYGLLFSTILTLVLLPAFYITMDKIKK
ncbi:Multidrug resistance protein MdtC [Paraliobacillus sp. PM-2]|uniref:efflux RND transporter permease subunit n=1 Tax=Paraliobacillus sp. PM-2 TaxID=1462524 RepID=UPI00061CDA10|nr:efflux RND transporter permease subunit [Paraliobacillus sp. PM-2]CQR46115.1 Multidrug resistance protein MdtC [Paraliobacillus sp. PM-2]